MRSWNVPETYVGDWGLPRTQGGLKPHVARPINIVKPYNSMAMP